MSEREDYKIDAEYDARIEARTSEDDMEDLEHEIEEAISHYPNLSTFEIQSVLEGYIDFLKRQRKKTIDFINKKTERKCLESMKQSSNRD